MARNIEWNVSTCPSTNRPRGFHKPANEAADFRNTCRWLVTGLFPWLESTLGWAGATRVCAVKSQISSWWSNCVIQWGYQWPRLPRLKYQPTKQSSNHPFIHPSNNNNLTSSRLPSSLIQPPPYQPLAVFHPTCHTLYQLYDGNHQ